MPNQFQSGMQIEQHLKLRERFFTFVENTISVQCGSCGIWRDIIISIYQLLSYKGDVDLEAKLDDWERFYNFARPHDAHIGETPHEALRDKLQQLIYVPQVSSGYRLNCQY